MRRQQGFNARENGTQPFQSIESDVAFDVTGILRSVDLLNRFIRQDVPEQGHILSREAEGRHESFGAGYLTGAPALIFATIASGVADHVPDQLDVCPIIIAD